MAYVMTAMYLPTVYFIVMPENPAYDVHTSTWLGRVVYILSFEFNIIYISDITIYYEWYSMIILMH